MPNKSGLEKLIESASLAVMVIGVIVFVIGAAGGLPLGNPPLQVTDVSWRLALGAMGVVLTVVGLLLVSTESRPSRFSRTKVRQFDYAEDALHYVLKRMKEAKKGVCDLSWEEPLKTPLALTGADVEKYLSIIEEVSRRVRYREIIVFCESQGRVDKVSRLMRTAGKHYQLAGYADLPAGAPARRNFVIIDDEEVILLYDLAVRQREIVGYFRRWYDDLWASATPIKVSDVEPDLGLLEEAERRISNAKLPHPYYPTTR